MNLLELQRRMSEDVRRPLTPDFKMQSSTENGLSTSEIVSSYIMPNPLLTSFERLEIYNRQYWFRVIGAVSEDYPALNAILGPKRFDSLVRAYLEENPSTSFTLRDLGGQLPTWLAAHPEYAGTRHHLAVDVARLELAYVEAFDKASVPPLRTADFAGLLPDSTLSLQPHLQLLDLRYPVDEIVLAVRKNTPEIDIVSNAVAERKVTARTSLPRTAGIGLAAKTIAAAAVWRDRTGQGQDIHVDIRKAFRRFSGFFDGIWETMNGRSPAMGAFDNNPFFKFPLFRETRDGRHITTLSFYPKMHQRALNFFRCSDSVESLQNSILQWRADELEVAAAECWSAAQRLCGVARVGSHPHSIPGRDQLEVQRLPAMGVDLSER